MPVITASGEEAVVTAWFVDEGQVCTEGQMIAEVQAEKVSAEVTAPGAGSVFDRVGVNVPVLQGEPICRILASNENPAVVLTGAPPAEEGESGSRVVASPSARRVARELGVDISAVAGTGPAGRITEGDVRTAAGPAGADIPGLRAVIARNMLRSSTGTAAVTLHSTVDLGEAAPPHMTATVVKTVAETLPAHPFLNGQRQDGTFVPAEVAQVAVAIQTEEGLIAPVVRDTASRSVEDISGAIRDLAARATAKLLTAEDFAGGTFTVTNLGVYGVDGFTPIINLPQVAILGVGAVRLVPGLDKEGRVTARHQMVLSLTFDHAYVDGAPAAAFLQHVVESLAG